MMDLNKIFEYVIEGMKWLTVGGVLTYIGIMLSNPVSLLLSKRIRDQQELDTVIEQESSKLGLEGIKGILCDEVEGLAYKDSDGTPIIEIGGVSANRGRVRHELYHHYKGDCETLANNWLNEIKYWLVKEPRACLYQSIRIKI